MAIRYSDKTDVAINSKLSTRALLLRAPLQVPLLSSVDGWSKAGSWRVEIDRAGRPWNPLAAAVANPIEYSTRWMLHQGRSSRVMTRWRNTPQQWKYAIYHTHISTSEISRPPPCDWSLAPAIENKGHPCSASTGYR